MGTINTYTAYHATDQNNVASIICDDFKFNKKDIHWLGNGVYFFIDKQLAIKWGGNHSAQYGTINNCAIIEAFIEVDDEHLCDMRMLDTYCYVKNWFEKYMEVVSTSQIKIKGVSQRTYHQRIRCAFFDWLVKELDLKCIIAYFSERKSTLPTKADKEDNEGLFAQFKMPYIEVQLCVFDTDCISKKELI